MMEFALMYAAGAFVYAILMGVYLYNTPHHMPVIWFIVASVMWPLSVLLLFLDKALGGNDE